MSSFQMALISLHLLLLQSREESYVFPGSHLYCQHQPAHAVSSRCSEPQPEDHHIQPTKEHLGQQGTSGLTGALRTSPNLSASYKWIVTYPIWLNLQICCRDHNVNVSTLRQCEMPVHPICRGILTHPHLPFQHKNERCDPFHTLGQN